MLRSAQVCTGVMLHGYPLVKSLCGDLQARALCEMSFITPSWCICKVIRGIVAMPHASNGAAHHGSASVHDSRARPFPSQP